MTTPVAITLNTASASTDSPAADADDGFPFADMLALINPPGSKQALIQTLQQSEGQAPTGPHGALLNRLSQMSQAQRQALLAPPFNQRGTQGSAAMPLPYPALTQPEDPRQQDSRVPETAEAVAPQAIAALLAMLPPRGDAQTLTPGRPGANAADSLTRPLLSPRQTQQNASLSHLLADGRADAASADSAPLLSAKASPVTPGVTPQDTVSLATPFARRNATDTSPGASAQAMTTTALHTVPPAAATPQVHLAPLASATTATAPLLNAPLGSGEWQQALGQQVLMFARNGQHQAELRLHPQDLGAVQISLRLDDNQAQLHMTAAHGQVRAALEAALPHLRTALAESGIQLGQSSIGSEAQSQWGNGQQQGQAPQPDATPFIVADNTVSTPLDSVVPTPERHHLGAVDISV